jgi:hypothetical protein
MKTGVRGSLAVGLVFLGAALTSALHGPARAAETMVVDFEAGPAALTQIPGISYENVQVVSPARIASSSGPDMSAATSGRWAALTLGARIHFSLPVIKVQMSVSPSFINVPRSMESAYFTAYLLAYKADGTLVAHSETPVISAVPLPEAVTNFTPSTISVSSATPISSITLDFDNPAAIDGSVFFFDDLVLTLGKPITLVRPVLQIQKTGDRTAHVYWGPYFCELQWTTNLAEGDWQTISNTPSFGAFVDTREAASMFFRVRRILPP